MAGGLNSTITKTYAGHLDLLNSTLEHFDKGYFSNTQKYTDNALVRTFFDEAVEDTSGGNRLEWEVRVRASGTAQWTAPYATTANVVQNFTVKAYAPWRAFEEKIQKDDLESNMNRGPEQLVDMMIPKMDAATEGINNMLEEALSGSLPTLTDTDQVYGVQYYLGPCGSVTSSAYVTATDTVGGFNGQCFRSDDGGASYTIAGIDASDVANSRWRSYCATHSGVMDATLVQQIVRALTRTDFKTMPGIQGKSSRRSGKQVLLMGHTFADQYEAIVNSGPDWLNGDAAGKTGIKIRTVPVVRVPVFDSYSHLPVFGVNTKHIYGRTLAGYWMKKYPFMSDRESMHTFTSAILGQCQLQCDNRRQAGFQIHGVIAST